jgi:hypothetical protein
MLIIVRSYQLGVTQDCWLTELNSNIANYAVPKKWSGFCRNGSDR